MVPSDLILAGNSRELHADISMNMKTAIVQYRGLPAAVFGHHSEGDNTHDGNGIAVMLTDVCLPGSICLARQATSQDFCYSTNLLSPSQDNRRA